MHALIHVYDPRAPMCFLSLIDLVSVCGEHAVDTRLEVLYVPGLGGPGGLHTKPMVLYSQRAATNRSRRLITTATTKLPYTIHHQSQLDLADSSG